MYSVSVSLGACNACVAVRDRAGQDTIANKAAAIKVVANVAGHRRTPIVATLTEQEMLFGENALQIYPRQPNKTVPYLFSYAAAAAALADALRSHDKHKESTARQLLRTVDEASKVKYTSHCPIEEESVAADVVPERRRLGFYYEKSTDKGTIGAFVSAEDLFVEFLNYLKQHAIDSVCGLTTTGAENTTREGRAKRILLTLVVPRSSFPDAADGSKGLSRSGALTWLREAVRVSYLESVCRHISIIFSDEACLFAVDSLSTGTKLPYFLFPPSSSPWTLAEPLPSPGPIRHGNVLVIDWGAHSLALSLLRTVNGFLVLKNDDHEGATPYLYSTPYTTEDDTGGYFSVHRSYGGDAIDARLAECVAAQYILKNKGMFSSKLGGNTHVLMQALSNFLNMRHNHQQVTAILAACIPARSLNRLRFCMEERKAALNTNPNANAVSVEVEAFYEGMDLQDNQTISRNKFESALCSATSLDGVFTDILTEFIKRFEKELKHCPINHVAIMGGMSNMPVIVQLIRKAIFRFKSLDSSNCFDFASLRFLDDLLSEKGIGADELSAVGGCFYSIQIARLSFQQLDIKNKLHKRKKNNRLNKITAIALQETEEALFRIWSSSLLKSEGEDEDEVGDVDTHVKILKANLYVYVGENAAWRFEDLSTGGADRVVLPENELCCVFPEGTPLPSRVTVTHQASTEPLVLYFFSDLFDDLKSLNQDAETEGHTVRPVCQSGLAIPPLEGSMSIVLSLRCTHNQEGEERLSLMVHTTAQKEDKQTPALLTPHNCNKCVDIILY